MSVSGVLAAAVKNTQQVLDNGAQYITGSAQHIWAGVTGSIGNIINKFTNKKTPEQLANSTDVDSVMYEYAEYVSTQGILGLPPRFTALADMRLFGYGAAFKGSVDPEKIIGSRSITTIGSQSIGAKAKSVYMYSQPFEGTKWLDVYMKWGSLIYLEIGRPVFFKGLDKELVNAIVGGKAESDEHLGNSISLEAQKANVSTMITFKPAGVDYSYQVKILTDTIATFLGLDNVYTDFRNNCSGDYKGSKPPGSSVPNVFKDNDSCSSYFGLPQSYGDVTENSGSNRTIKSTDSSAAAKDAAGKVLTKAEKTLKVGKFDLSVITNDIYAEVTTSTICLYADGGVELPFNMQHSTGQSKLLGMLTDNPISSATSELSFLVSDFNYQVDQAGDDGGLLAKIDNVWVKKVLSAIPIGAKLIAPEVWQGVDVAKEVTFKIVFQAVTPHKISIFNEVLVPYMHLFAAFAPMNITSVSNRMLNRIGAYAPPFVVRLYSKGAVNINLGLITSINVNKVPKELTIDGLPTRLEIDITVKDLYDTIGIPQNPASRINVLNCMGLTEYLGSLTGVSMSHEKMLTKYIEVLGDLRTYAFNAPIRASNRVQQNTLNAYNQFISSQTSMAYGRVNKI